MTLDCGEHGEDIPWKGHIMCTDCGRMYWPPWASGLPNVGTYEPVLPKNPPYCDCLARLFPRPGEGGVLVDFREPQPRHRQLVSHAAGRGTATQVCHQCYEAYAPRAPNFVDEAPPDAEKH